MILNKNLNQYSISIYEHKNLSSVMIEGQPCWNLEKFFGFWAASMSILLLILLLTEERVVALQKI